jgi:hypothetical protein
MERAPSAYPHGVFVGVLDEADRYAERRPDVQRDPAPGQHPVGQNGAGHESLELMEELVTGRTCELLRNRVGDAGGHD